MGQNFFIFIFRIRIHQREKGRREDAKIIKEKRDIKIDIRNGIKTIIKIIQREVKKLFTEEGMKVVKNEKICRERVFNKRIFTN